jgi:hypothetical protein
MMIIPAAQQSGCMATRQRGGMAALRHGDTAAWRYAGMPGDINIKQGGNQV